MELKANIASTVPRYIRSDRNKIYRTLLNLLGNAIKFTQSGSITLGLECLHIDSTKAHLKFSVSDTGIGIPEEAQAQVFNRFFKVSSSYKGVYNGHGLGLHIAQSYVELLGGHITLTSKEGLGSTFNFDLECELGFIQPKVVNNELKANPLLELSGNDLHLLLVEDNLIALKTLEFLLGQKGHTFDSASTGEEALALFQKKHFDLLIMDLGLPDITGTTLSQHIRSHEKSLNKSFTPIIGLTGHNQEATREECINCGMNEVFTKPAQIESLESCIQKLTHNAAQQIKAPLGLGLPDTEKELPAYAVD